MIFESPSPSGLLAFQKRMQVSEEKPHGRFVLFLMRLGILGELLQLFARGDRKWMLPLGLVLGLLGLILVVLQSLEYIAPFVYMAF